jgi:putative flippase GtrA
MPVFDRVLLRFVIVGVINTIAGSIIMFGLYNIAGASYWLSSAANYFFGTILSFFLNKYFTFKVKSWSVTIVAGFILNIAVCYGIAYGAAKPVTAFLIDFLCGKSETIAALLDPLGEKFRDNAAMFAGMCLFTALNYCGQRFIVFRQKEERG